MKRLKFLSLVLFSLLLISCSPETIEPLSGSSNSINPTPPDNPTTTNSISNNNYAMVFTLLDSNIEYKVSEEDSSITKWENKELKYYYSDPFIDNSSINVTSLEDNWEDGYLVYNETAEQKMLISNIQERPDGFIFDFESDDGTITKGIYLHVEEGDIPIGANGFGSWLKRVILNPIKIIVEISLSLTYNNCADVSDSVNCPEGSAKHVVSHDDDCEVYCECI